QASWKHGGPAQLASTALPRDQMTKAVATVRSGGREIDAKLPPLTAADSTTAPLLAATGGPGTWSLQPDIVTVTTPASSLVIPLKYRPWTGGDELRPRRIVFSSPQAHVAAVTNWLGRPRGAEMDVTTATIER